MMRNAIRNWIEAAMLRKHTHRLREVPGRDLGLNSDLPVVLRRSRIFPVFQAKAQIRFCALN
jgi:hypothetical protein